MYEQYIKVKEKVFLMTKVFSYTNFLQCLYLVTFLYI